MNNPDPESLLIVIKDLRRRIKELQVLDKETNGVYNYDDAYSYKQTIETLIKLKISYEKWRKRILIRSIRSPTE